MTDKNESLQTWLQNIASVIAQSDNMTPEDYVHFIQEPQLALKLVDVMTTMNEKDADEHKPFFSACVFALEICVSQLQASAEAGNKPALKILDHLMSHLAQAILSNEHSLNFWLPVLNAFYEVHVDLNDELKEAYFELANNEELPYEAEDEAAHLGSIRDLINELSDLTVFEITENFFAQSYAMPADFFSDLIYDLYSVPEGQDIPVIMLLHPSAEVREVVLSTINALIDQIVMTPASLSRLQIISNWYPDCYKAQFERLIKLQRKKGVVFNKDSKPASISIKASEVDGSGAQGVFIHCKKNRRNRLCGLLLKYEVGIKDAWFTPEISPDEVERYYQLSFDDTVMLREVDESYFMLLANHFLALNLQRGEPPNLHFLEMQEELGVQFIPRKIAVDERLESLLVSINPFTPERIEDALTRSKAWTKTKRFTESWFIEAQTIDKVVNRFCSFVDGVKVCDFVKAQSAVITEIMEPERKHWCFHFLWVALWLKAKARKNEKSWEDALIIAHVIHSGTPLADIPILQEIGHQTLVNSIETMHERRTHLT